MTWRLIDLTNQMFDWKPAEESFVNGQRPLLGISADYGIPYQTVQRYAVDHQWSVKRLYNKFVKNGERLEEITWLQRRLRY